MFEHIIQIGPMLVLAGLMAGWVAEAASRAGGYGFILDMVVGLVGSVVLGGLFQSQWPSPDPSLMAATVVAACGAAGLIIAQRTVFPAAGSSARRGPGGIRPTS